MVTKQHKLKDTPHFNEARDKLRTVGYDPYPEHFFPHEIPH